MLGRLEYAQDLPAVEARYHQSCSSNFRQGFSIPQLFQSNHINDTRKSRPTNEKPEYSFLQVIQFLDDHKDNQITVSDLVAKMEEMCGDKAYSCAYMKKKIIEYFDCEILISELNGQKNVITFKSTADSLLHSFYRKSESSSSEKDAVIKAAAQLIVEDIKSLQCDKQNYPTTDDILNLDANSKYVPTSLQLFLEQILTCKGQKRKVVSIGQCIVQNCVPRSTIKPLQIGLGVQMHHHFGSKFLIDTLNSLGFCSSYSEVQRFEVSAAQHWNIEIEKDQDNQAVQFVADNVDHNLGTVDGYNTFHGMGIIATITPGVDMTRTIPRTNDYIQDLTSIGKINISFYNQNKRVMTDFRFQCLADLSSVQDHTENVDFLLKFRRPLSSKIPSWSGFMQTVQRGDHPGKSSVIFLPMIDMNPSDLTCIYSTSVSEQASKLKVSPVVTFDQPLYWKALQIVSSDCQDISVNSIVYDSEDFIRR